MTVSAARFPQKRRFRADSNNVRRPNAEFQESGYFLPSPPVRNRLRRTSGRRRGGLPWGSPAAAKTTMVGKDRQYLADKKLNVVLLLCDMTAPMLPCICPASELECERSLGEHSEVLCKRKNLVKNNLITHKRLGYLTIWGCSKVKTSIPTRPTARCRPGNSSIACERSPPMWSSTAAATSPTISLRCGAHGWLTPSAAGQLDLQEHQLSIQPAPAAQRMPSGIPTAMVKSAANVKPQLVFGELDRAGAEAMWPSRCLTQRSWRPSSSASCSPGPDYGEQALSQGDYYGMPDILMLGQKRMAHFLLPWQPAAEAPTSVLKNRSLSVRHL